MSESREGPFLLMVSGPMLTFAGIRTFAKMRLTENIPCSKVRSLAMGLVEVKGQARPRKPLISPISHRPCCWWQFKIQEYRRSGKSSRWVTLRESQSGEPFFLQDDTGTVLIDPLNAELILPEQIYPLDAKLRSQLQNSFAGKGLSMTVGWFGGPEMRAVEQLILEHSPVYVMGHYTQRVNMLEGRKERLSAAFRKAKKDSVAVQQADKNADGQLDEQEWDAFRREIEERFLQEEQAREDDIPPDERFVICANPEISMLISTSNEQELIRRWLWSAPLMIIGGIAMTAGGIWMGFATGYPLWLNVGALVVGLLLGLFIKKLKGVPSWD